MLSQVLTLNGLGLSHVPRPDDTDLSSKPLDAPSVTPPKLITAFANSETPTENLVNQSPIGSSPRNTRHRRGSSMVTKSPLNALSPISPRRSSRRAALTQLIGSLSPKIGGLSPKIGGSSPKMTSPSRLSPLTKLRKRLSGDSPNESGMVDEKLIGEGHTQVEKRSKKIEPKAERGDYGYYIPVSHWTDEPEI